MLRATLAKFGILGANRTAADAAAHRSICEALDSSALPIQVPPTTNAAVAARWENYTSSLFDAENPILGPPDTMIWQDGQTCRVDSRPFCAEEVLSVPSAEAPMGLRGPAAAISGPLFPGADLQ